MQEHRTSNPSPEWFAVQVTAGRERMTVDNLRLRNYEVFLPCYREQRRWSDRVKSVSRALFAGYVFSRITAGAAGLIVSAPGVIRIVGDGRGPVSIPNDEIDAIRRIVDGQVPAEPWPIPEIGQKVRIEIGPLQGIEGVVALVRNDRRLVVSIPLLQRAVAVEIDLAWLDIVRPELHGWTR